MNSLLLENVNRTRARVNEEFRAKLLKGKHFMLGTSQSPNPKASHPQNNP
jgi:hypothetical protein